MLRPAGRAILLEVAVRRAVEAADVRGGAFRGRAGFVRRVGAAVVIGVGEGESL